MAKTVREKINREKLIQLSEIMQRNANTTLKELLAQAVVEKVFESTESAPDISTLHRALTKKVGFKWQAPKYDDPRAARTRVTYERCEFRRALQEGLVRPESTLCLDETSFYVGGEAPTRAWGTIYKKPNIEKNKMGGIKVVMYLTIGYRLDGAGKPLAFLHWLCVPPQRSNKPLTDRIESWESEEKLDSLKLKETLTEAYVNSLTAAGLKKELQTLGLRSSSLNAETMREVLKRVGKAGTRVGELRERKTGRPELGVLRPHTPTAYYFSEYLHQCLGTFAAGDGLWSEGEDECVLSSDLGIRQCPDFGVREYAPDLRETTLMMDNASYHVYTTESTVSPFQKWVIDKLGMKGVLFSPAYSSWFNPTEYAFSFIKRYVRKYNPQSIADLLLRIRQASQKITGEFIQGWFKKASFRTGPEVLGPVDPNAGVADRCSLPVNARFQQREHIVCVDSQGTVKREKKVGHTRFSTYADHDTETEGTLENVSGVKRAGIPPRKRPRVEVCAEPTDGSKLRWVGVGVEPPGLVHGSSESLFQGGDDMAEIERIRSERKTDRGMEYLVRWKGFSSEHDTWLPATEIQGLGSLLQYWRDKNKRASESKKLKQNQQQASKTPPKYKPNREPKTGDVIAIYAPKDMDELLFVGEVIDQSDTKLHVHWWSAKKVDGTWSPQFLAKKGKGHAGPFTNWIWKEGCLDVLNNLKGQKKGKIEPDQLGEMLKIAQAYKKKR